MRYTLTAFKDYGTEGKTDIKPYPKLVSQETVDAINWLMEQSVDSTLQCIATEVEEKP